MFVDAVSSTEMLISLLQENQQKLLISCSRERQILRFPDHKSHFEPIASIQHVTGMAARAGRLYAAGASGIFTFESGTDPKKEQRNDLWHQTRKDPHEYYDFHDLQIGTDGIWVVSTLLSCLSLLDREGRLSHPWKPSFISALKPEDRCHLNGLAMQDGKPRFVTACHQTDSRYAWRSGQIGGGVLIDVPTGEVIIEGLSMPHSPRFIGNDLFVLNSAQQQLLRIEHQAGKYEEACTLPGFPRGMVRVGDYLIIGISKPRHFPGFDQPLEQYPFEHASIAVVHLPGGAITACVPVPGITNIYEIICQGK